VATELVTRRIIAPKAQQSVEEIAGRVQACVLESLRATPLNDRRVLRGVLGLPLHEMFHCRHETRFAQTRLADQQHNLTHPFLRLLPTVLQEADLRITTGQRRESGRCGGIDLPGRFPVDSVTGL
jgi:hypothetical protein